MVLQNLRINTARVSYEKVRRFGPSRKVLVVQDVREIFVGPRGVGIRHTPFDRSNPTENRDNTANVAWTHQVGPHELIVKGPIDGVSHVYGSLGIAAAYLVAGRTVRVSEGFQGPAFAQTPVVYVEIEGAHDAAVADGSSVSSAEACIPKESYVLRVAVTSDRYLDVPVDGSITVAMDKGSVQSKLLPAGASVKLYVKSANGVLYGPVHEWA